MRNLCATKHRCRVYHTIYIDPNTRTCCRQKHNRSLDGTGGKSTNHWCTIWIRGGGRWHLARDLIVGQHFTTFVLLLSLLFCVSLGLHESTGIASFRGKGWSRTTTSLVACYLRPCNRTKGEATAFSSSNATVGTRVQRGEERGWKLGERR